MPVETTYDGDGEALTGKAALDAAKSALIAELLRIHADLVFVLDLSSKDSDLHPDDLALHMRVQAREPHVTLETMTAEDALCVELYGQIQEYRETMRRVMLSCGGVEMGSLRTTTINAAGIHQAMQNLPFADRHLIASRARKVSEETWAGTLEHHGRLDLLDHFQAAFDEFEHKMLHGLVEV